MALFGELLLDHFRNPRNAGELQDPDLTVEAENPACGDKLRLSLRFGVGRIVEVRYMAIGCTASVAAGSALTELLSGRPVGSLANLGAAEVADALGGLPAESRHAAELCADLIRRVERESLR